MPRRTDISKIGSGPIVTIPQGLKPPSLAVSGAAEAAPFQNIRSFAAKTGSEVVAVALKGRSFSCAALSSRESALAAEVKL